MKEGQSTPWGAVQTVREVIPGMHVVTTAGHGGVHLVSELADKIPAGLADDSFLKSRTWFEEDCDWCIPFVVFEKVIAKNGDEHSKKVIKNKWHTEAYNRYHNN